MLNRILPLICTLLLQGFIVSSQVATDLNMSVPLWLEYNSDNSASLNWISDSNAGTYQVSSSFDNFSSTVNIEVIDGSSSSYNLGTINPGFLNHYQVTKDGNGKGLISVGLEMPLTHIRGRCIIAIDNILTQPLESEILRLMSDMEMDGWQVDTLSISRQLEPPAVKSIFQGWYDSDFSGSQSILLLGHVTIPYSGNSAYDGHGDHQGAWIADSYYGDTDGLWTDQFINNTTPSREANKNIPGDGKFDQSLLPSPIEIEIGRVDFHNLPAFEKDEIELTRQYLDKNHRFKHGEIEYPRRAFVDNNFAGFAEGFGQTGWKNYPTLFTADSVSVKNYDVLIDNKYLCSYACGAGSYTSCGGVGNTQSVWVDRDNQTVFTFLFGSYFGDWDVTNNFLRSALASGDVLTNAWAGRPSWHVFPMALGKHIGYCTRLTQNASDLIFGQGFAARAAQVSLLGDPTLRLHSMKSAKNLELSFMDGNINLKWEASPDAINGYVIYRKTELTEWNPLEEFYANTDFVDLCVDANATYSYMIKAIRLEHTGSGSYYNTSLGISETITIAENPFIQNFYADTDGDGYGDINQVIQDCALPIGYVTNNQDCDDTNNSINPNAIENCDGLDNNCDGQIDEGLLLTYYADMDNDGYGDPENTTQECSVPTGFTDNSEDCDDNDASIFPGANEIANNDIDEDCDGEDLVVSSTEDIRTSQINIFPNPSRHMIYIHTDILLKQIIIRNMQGQRILSFENDPKEINVSELTAGIYTIEFHQSAMQPPIMKKIVVSK